MRRGAAWLAGALAAGLLAAPPARAACEVTAAAELATVADARFALVPVAIDGRAGALLVDTGSDITLLTQDAARVFGLAADPTHSTRLRGIGGLIDVPNVVVRRFALGGVVSVDRSLALGTLPMRFATDPPVVGLLGADVLAGYDVMFDLPRARLALYRVTGCAGQAMDAGFAAAHHVYPVPTRRYGAGRLLLDVSVGGTRLTAMLDSGAAGMVMTTAAAERLGVTPQMLAQDRLALGHGIDQAAVRLRRHRFTLAVGNETFADQPVAVADVDLGSADMLLGMDFLRQRRMWISYATDRLYIQPVAAAPPGPAPARKGFSFSLD